MKNKKLLENLAEIIYEATRLEAKWSNRSIVPEKWNNRDDKFRTQFIDIIDKYMSQDNLPTPKEAHDSWVESYKQMGWKFGEKRDIKKKTHPDMVPFEKLPKDERDKDAIFLMAVWIAKALMEATAPPDKIAASMFGISPELPKFEREEEDFR